MRSSEASSWLVQELVLYAASVALSCLVLFAGLRHLNPNRAASQKAQQQKKEIAKRLGRPLISTTPYEVRSRPPSPLSRVHLTWPQPSSVGVSLTDRT
jgi:hypothetical protein